MCLRDSVLGEMYIHYSAGLEHELPDQAVCYSLIYVADVDGGFLVLLPRKDVLAVRIFLENSKKREGSSPMPSSRHLDGVFEVWKVVEGFPGFGRCMELYLEKFAYQPLHTLRCNFQKNPRSALGKSLTSPVWLSTMAIFP